MTDEYVVVDQQVLALVHEFAVEARKLMAKQEKKTEENKALAPQDVKDDSYQATYSFRT